MTEILRSSSKVPGYWNLVIGNYLELGIWLLEFYNCVSRTTVSEK
jgi:hypothetical protein